MSLPRPSVTPCDTSGAVCGQTRRGRLETLNTVDRVIAMVALAGTVLTGCGDGSGPTATSPRPDPVANHHAKRFRSPGLSFRYPADWHVWPQGDAEFSGPWAVVVANAALRPPCKTGAADCGLRPDDLQFTWTWCDRNVPCSGLTHGTPVGIWNRRFSRN